MSASRQLAWFAIAFALVATTGCSSARSIPTSLPDVEEEGSGEPLPGAPILVEVDTSRAHVVRVVAPEVLSEMGRLQISSTEPGVMVAIDDDEPLPLPLSVEVATGTHQVVATCPDSTTETSNVTVEPGVTVHLHVCSNMSGP